nr:MAG TPA: hypothetical protein [Caudoviricetes sp.]
MLINKEEIEIGGLDFWMLRSDFLGWISGFMGKNKGFYDMGYDKGMFFIKT